MQFRGLPRSNRTGQEMPSLTYNLLEIAEPVERLERLVRKEEGVQIYHRFHTWTFGSPPHHLQSIVWLEPPTGERACRRGTLSASWDLPRCRIYLAVGPTLPYGTSFRPKRKASSSGRRDKRDDASWEPKLHVELKLELGLPGRAICSFPLGIFTCLTHVS